MLSVVQLPDVFAHICPPDAGVTLDVHVVSQSQQHLQTVEEVRAHGQEVVMPAGTELPSESVLPALWLEQESGPGSLSPADRNHISPLVKTTNNSAGLETSLPHLDVQTLQHRHAEGGCLSCSRLRPAHIRQTESDGRWTPRGHQLSSYWAMTSRPLMICLMALCWMADGFSKPETGDMNHVTGVRVGR